MYFRDPYSTQNVCIYLISTIQQNKFSAHPLYKIAKISPPDTKIAKVLTALFNNGKILNSNINKLP